MSVQPVSVNAVDSASGAWWISAGTSRESQQAKAPTELAPQAAKAAVSPMAQMLAKLDTLVKSDPQKFADVTSAIASQLAAAAKGASASDAGVFDRLAAQFRAASESRDVSPLAPPQAPTRGYVPSNAEPSDAARGVMDGIVAAATAPLG